MSQLKGGFPASGYMDLSAILHSSIQQGKLQSDTETNKQMFLAYVNNAEMSMDNIRTLKQSLEEEIEKSFPQQLAMDRAKLESGLQQLIGSTDKFNNVIQYAINQLQASAIKPRIKPWIDAFHQTTHNITEDEFSVYEANDPFIQSCIVHIDGLLNTFKHSLTPHNYDCFTSLLITEVAQTLEKAVLKTSFNRLGGLQFDKEVRSLVSYLSSVCTWSVRDKFARLMQLASILNMEALNEIHEYWGGGTLTWRLTPNEVRQVLSLRVDFRSEDIRRLKL